MRFLKRFLPATDDIPLSDARERMRDLLQRDAPSTRAFPAAAKPANVKTTCVEPGITPVVTVKPIPRIELSRRESIIAGLVDLQKRAEQAQEEDLAFALQSCYRLITQGTGTLKRTINEERDWFN